MEENKKLTLTAKEAAAELNVSMPTFYQLAASDGFPALRVGKKIVVNSLGLQQWLKENCGRVIPV